MNSSYFGIINRTKSNFINWNNLNNDYHILKHFKNNKKFFIVFIYILFNIFKIKNDSLKLNLIKLRGRKINIFKKINYQYTNPINFQKINHDIGINYLNFLK